MTPFLVLRGESTEKSLKEIDLCTKLKRHAFLTYVVGFIQLQPERSSSVWWHFNEFGGENAHTNATIEPLWLTRIDIGIGRGFSLSPGTHDLSVLRGEMWLLFTIFLVHPLQLRKAQKTIAFHLLGKVQNSACMLNVLYSSVGIHNVPNRGFTRPGALQYELIYIFWDCLLRLGRNRLGGCLINIAE